MSDRKEFEAWYLDAWGCTEDNLDSLFEESPHGNEYYRFGVRLAWQAWQQATKQAEAKCAAMAAELESAEKRIAELDALTAGMEQEPVAWKYRLVELATEGAGPWKMCLAPMEPGRGAAYRTEVIPLYAAPQLPQQEAINGQN